jgi:hypothetical protein
MRPVFSGRVCFVGLDDEAVEKWYIHILCMVVMHASGQGHLTMAMMSAIVET